MITIGCVRVFTQLLLAGLLGPQGISVNGERNIKLCGLVVGGFLLSVFVENLIYFIEYSYFTLLNCSESVLVKD